MNSGRRSRKARQAEHFELVTGLEMRKSWVRSAQQCGGREAPGCQGLKSELGVRKWREEVCQTSKDFGAKRRQAVT